MFSYALFYLQQNNKEGRGPKFSYVKFFLIFLKKNRLPRVVGIVVDQGREWLRGGVLPNERGWLISWH
jgi:hypothetical protein